MTRFFIVEIGNAHWRASAILLCLPEAAAMQALPNRAVSPCNVFVATSGVTVAVREAFIFGECHDSMPDIILSMIDISGFIY